VADGNFKVDEQAARETLRERYRVAASVGRDYGINPRNVAGTISVGDHKVLMCRRAIEPRYGYWTLAAGFMELGETTARAAFSGAS
jgi:8-oxo-dGTP pyrophosphatase MutT (NUDIX family)